MSDQHNESVHDRLNREMRREYLGTWKVWVTVVAVLGVFAWMLIPQPVILTHKTGVVMGVTTLASESGPRIRIAVDIGGTRVEAGTRARLVAPANGDTICLRHSIGQWTGMETFHMTDMRFCDVPNPTTSVD